MKLRKPKATKAKVKGKGGKMEEVRCGSDYLIEVTGKNI